MKFITIVTHTLINKIMLIFLIAATMQRAVSIDQMLRKALPVVQRSRRTHRRDTGAPPTV